MDIHVSNIGNNEDDYSYIETIISIIGILRTYDSKITIRKVYNPDGYIIGHAPDIRLFRRLRVLEISNNIIDIDDDYLFNKYKYRAISIGFCSQLSFSYGSVFIIYGGRNRAENIEIYDRIKIYDNNDLVIWPKIRCHTFIENDEKKIAYSFKASFEGYLFVEKDDQYTTSMMMMAYFTINEPYELYDITHDNEILAIEHNLNRY